ncbi:MAG: NB-ARC domain-containing protein [Planktomarina sp.]
MEKVEAFFAYIANMTLGDWGSLASILGAIEMLIFLLLSGAAIIYRKTIARKATEVFGSKAPWRFPIPPKVFGRKQQLKDLHGILTSDNNAAVVAVNGMGGVGKTTLAAEYARTYRGAYHGGMWINAETDTNLLTDLTTFAAALGQDVPEDDKNLPLAQAKTLLHNLPEHKKPWLIVFDNVEDRATVQDFLPGRTHVKVIQTSRQTHGWGDIQTVATEVLNVDDAQSDGVQLLMHHAKTKTGAEHAVTLAQTLGGLCLALKHAGCLIAQKRDLTFETYLEHYDAMLIKVPTDYKGADHSVAVSLLLSVEGLDDTTQIILAILAWYDGDHLYPDLITRAMEKWDGDAPLTADDVETAFEDLVGLSLLSYDRRTDRYTMHRLTSDVLRQEFGTDVAKAATVILAVQIDSLDPNTSAHWHTYKPLAPHALALGRKAEGAEDADLALVMNRFGVYFHQVGDVDGEVTASTFEQQIKARLYTDDDLSFIKGLASQGVAKMKADDFEDAEGDLRRAVELGRRHHPDTDDLSDWIMNLASCLLNKDKRQNKDALTEARELLKQAMAIFIAHHGEHSARVAHVHSELSVVWDALGDATRAAHHSTLARDIRREALDPKDARLAATEANAGVDELRAGQWAAAVDSVQRAFDIEMHNFEGDVGNKKLRTTAGWLITANLAAIHAQDAAGDMARAQALAAQFGFDWAEREFYGHCNYLEALHRQKDGAKIEAHLARYPDAAGALEAVEKYLNRFNEDNT